MTGADEERFGTDDDVEAIDAMIGADDDAKVIDDEADASARNFERRLFNSITKISMYITTTKTRT